MLRPYELENKVLSIIERVEAGQPIEDSLVELKAEWIDPEKAARRIAGHANAARGAPILWIVGVDEKKGVVGASYEELADWHAKVKAQFNGLSPSLFHLNVPVGGKTVVALSFETGRAPFVVKNPAYGKVKGDAVEFEVPWRDATRIRSASRSDLLRLLVPLQMLPEFEVLGGHLAVTCQKSRGDDPEYSIWYLKLDLYVVTASVERVVIPFHRCEAMFEVAEGMGWTAFDINSISLQPPRFQGIGARAITSDFEYSRTSGLLSATIDATREEVLIFGPGRVYLTARQETPIIEADFDNDANIVVSLLPVRADYAVKIQTTLRRSKPQHGETYRWEHA